MKYRKLGNTDLYVSCLGFGASPLGDAFQVIDPEEGARAVHMAVDHGINFFDVSPYYGLTLAEQRLGRALIGRRDKVILATKCGRYGKNNFDFSAKRVIESVDESLRRLRTDYVDLLEVHDVEFGDYDQIVEETLPALRRLQKTGKIRYVGVTGYSLGMLKRIVEATPVDAVLSYCRYNLMITDLDDVLTPVTKQYGVGLINASCLHMGILTNEGPPEWHPAPTELLEAGRKALQLCNQHGTDLSRVALRFCLDHNEVSSSLVGMATTQHVKENLEVMGSRSKPELLEQLQHIFEPVFNYLWPSGRPENQDSVRQIRRADTKLAAS
jgi:L-galactose dehydrogenase